MADELKSDKVETATTEVQQEEVKEFPESKRAKYI